MLYESCLKNWVKFRRPGSLQSLPKSLHDVLFVPWIVQGWFTVNTKIVMEQLCNLASFKPNLSSCIAREAEEAQLSAELGNTSKGASRATYVRRITELIRNSKKQDADIARIIHDTRELQRESNMSQDKLLRLHALVDETVFRYCICSF